MTMRASATRRVSTSTPTAAATFAMMMPTATGCGSPPPPLRPPSRPALQGREHAVQSGRGELPLQRSAAQRQGGTASPPTACRRPAAPPPRLTACGSCARPRPAGSGPAAGTPCPAAPRPRRCRPGWPAAGGEGRASGRGALRLLPVGQQRHSRRAHLPPPPSLAPPHTNAPSMHACTHACGARLQQVDQRVAGGARPAPLAALCVPGQLFEQQGHGGGAAHAGEQRRKGGVLQQAPLNGVHHTLVVQLRRRRR